MPSDALSRIRARGHIGIRLGLGRMQALLARLDDPQRALRGVLIAGTNGKGSVAAMVAAACAANGLSTSQSPSPHLGSYRERIVIDGKPIDEADLEPLLDEVLQASESGEPDHGPATEFELMTAAAFLWSVRRDVDVAVMEVGLGGRLDATNTWDADVAAITNVGLDHGEFLGDTIEAIASEKAAIIKPGSLAVTAAHGPALDVIERRARRLGVPLDVRTPLAIEHMDLSGLALRHERLGVFHVPLIGRHQAQNAATALGAIEALRAAGIADIEDARLVDGLAATVWPGRLEVLDCAGTPVILDGAHNADGAAALALSIDELADSLPDGRATLLLAVMRDKEVATIVSALTGSEMLRAARFVASGVPDTDRSLAAVDLADAWAAATGSKEAAHTVLAFEDADAALDRALDIAADAGGMLIVAGSLYLIGHVRERLISAPADD